MSIVKEPRAVEFDLTPQSLTGPSSTPFIVEETAPDTGEVNRPSQRIFRAAGTRNEDIPQSP